VSEVRVCALTHSYPGTKDHSLAALDLVIGRGEAHALLGGSGAGKTTLLNLLSGLLTPTRGRILFDGRDVAALPARHRNVAQVFQFPVLYESMPVADILAFPLRNRGWSGRDARRRALEIAERLELTPLLDRRARSLSLFQKQLVSIGRALARPDVALVLLDEPLTAVEPALKWQLRQVIKAIQSEQGATMIYVTHDQTEALTFADRISVMYEGRIIQTDSPKTLYEAPDHEHVAHFIGSPGMNLLPGTVADGAYWLAGERLRAAPGIAPGPCVVGFRPEWAVLEQADGGDGVPVRVTATRVLGVEAHRRVGLITAMLDDEPLRTRQAIDLQPGQQALLRIDTERLVAFRNGARLVTSAPGAIDTAAAAPQRA
jgi:glycerol transport system ATP-binding protein